MEPMSTIAFQRLSETVGAQVIGVAADGLINDDTDLSATLLEALDTHGVLVFRQLHLNDEAQVALCQRLGEVQRFPSHPVPEISIVSLDPAKTATAEYLKGTFDWHIDGSTDEVPNKATVLTAHALAEEGGQTEFASTYAAYDHLSEEEKDRFISLRVLHSFEAHQRRVHPNPTREAEADWATRPKREHPLVWRHRNGRNSLVLGATASHVVGWDPEDSERLLSELLDRATAPSLVYRHEWSVGDTVIWDNRGVLHRVCPYDASSPREMHRTTILGDEPIQ
jgi:alpha-ketoglutarate-dependent taurine dioxygenase